MTRWESAWGIIGSGGIVGLHKASVTTARARVNKQHLTWEVSPSFLSWHSISFVFQVEVDGEMGALLVGRCSSWGVLRFGGCQ